MGEPPRPFSRSLGCSWPLPRDERSPCGRPSLPSRPPRPWPQPPPPQLRPRYCAPTTATLGAGGARERVSALPPCAPAQGAGESATRGRPSRPTPRARRPPDHARGCRAAPGLGRGGSRARALGKRAGRRGGSRRGEGREGGRRPPWGATPASSLREHIVGTVVKLQQLSRWRGQGRAARPREAGRFITHTEYCCSRVGARGGAGAPSLPAAGMGSATPAPPRRSEAPSGPRHPRRQRFGENAVSRSPPRPRARLRQLRQHVATANPGVCSPLGWFCGYDHAS